MSRTARIDAKERARRELRGSRDWTRFWFAVGFGLGIFVMGFAAYLTGWAH